MSYTKIPTRVGLTSDIHVIIEIPADQLPIKYEIDKDTNCLFVDRFISTPMFYPANYGFIPNTLAEDGDPLDALVITPYPVAPGSVIRARPIGVLHMIDESGRDIKIITVPNEKVASEYSEIHELSELPLLLTQKIQHFFENYKDLESGKWTKVSGWGKAEEAQKEIENSLTS